MCVWMSACVHVCVYVCVRTVVVVVVVVVLFHERGNPFSQGWYKWGTLSACMSVCICTNVSFKLTDIECGAVISTVRWTANTG